MKNRIKQFTRVNIFVNAPMFETDNIYNKILYINMEKYLAVERLSIFKSFMLICMMTVAMVTRSQQAESSSYFIKWENAEYKFPVTSLELTYKATSEIQCAMECRARSRIEPCAGLAFISIKDQRTCALAIEVRRQKDENRWLRRFECTRRTAPSIFRSTNLS